MPEEIASPVPQDNLPQEPVETTWFDGLHEDVKLEKTLEKFKTEDGLNKLAQSYIGLEKKMGNAVWIPGEDATPEDVQNFRSKLGIPDSPDKYSLTYKEHEALKFNEEMDKAWREHCLKIGKTPKQAQEDTDFYADMMINAYESNHKAYETAVEEMKNEYGNEYQNVLDKANMVLRTFADPRDMESIKPFENDVRLVRLLAKIGDGMSEHSFRQGVEPTFENTKDEIMKKVAEKQTIYLDESRPASERKMASREAEMLLARIYGNKEVSGTGVL